MKANVSVFINGEEKVFMVNDQIVAAIEPDDMKVEEEVSLLLYETFRALGMEGHFHYYDVAGHIPDDDSTHDALAALLESHKTAADVAHALGWAEEEINKIVEKELPTSPAELNTAVKIVRSRLTALNQDGLLTDSMKELLWPTIVEEEEPYIMVGCCSIEPTTGERVGLGLHSPQRSWIVREWYEEPLEPWEGLGAYLEPGAEILNTPNLTSAIDRIIKVVLVQLLNDHAAHDLPEEQE